MVGVEMGDQDLVDVDQARARPQQLALRALTAVDQDGDAASANEERRQAALGSGRGTGRPQEKYAQIHAATLERCVNI